MGLFDALRGRGKQAAAPIPGAEAPPEDSRGFRPRTDGRYRAGDSILRFTGSLVTEEGDAADGVTRSGEYTPAGRFLLTAPLESSIAFTVQDSGADHFVARRTATADRSSAELRYEFLAADAPA